MATAQPPLVADRYRLVEPLGQGGMGRVWKARDEVLHRDVAIKEVVPPAGLTVDERAEMRERSLREARAIARLSHVNIVRIFDVLRTDADPWIVMEYVPSRSLQDVINSEGTIEPVRAAEIGLGMLAGLRAAHRAGVVHRDIKPANVLLSDDGRVVLTDWGLAVMPGDPNVTRTGLVLGSPAYIAPERARDGTAGPRSDLWSLGATLYAAVEGHSPFARPTAIATLSALASEPVPVPKRAGPLKPALTGLLRKDPQNRLDPDAIERLLRRAAGERLRSRGLFPGVRRTIAPRVRPAPAAPVRPQVVDERPSGDRSSGLQPSGGTPSAGLPPIPVSPMPVSMPPAPLPSQRDGPPPPAVARARVAVPAPVAAPRRTRADNKRALIVAAVALAAVVLAMAALLVVLRDDSNNNSEAPPGGSTAGPSAATSNRTSAAPTSGSTSGAPVGGGGNAGATSRPDPNADLPAGWYYRTDASGFSVPVPQGWAGGRDPDGRPEWRSPDGAVLLLIDQRRDPQPDPVKDWLNNEAARRSTYRDYQRIAIKKVPYWLNAADWEFTYTSARGTRLHVLNRGFVTAKDQAYSIYWSTPASQWDRYRDELQTVFDNFRPRR
ncbi:MAG TPA: serine/threonine-protein kinase [Asanoa sp.]|jgi:eukaryotic-like serine/threonine-protein kinase